MEKILSFLRSLWYNIVHDKLYSIFYVLGTAIAFIFIIILLQAMSLLRDDSAPFVNAGRSICFDSDIYTTNNWDGSYTLPYNIIQQLSEQINIIETGYMTHTESAFAVIDGKVRPASVGFVTPEYFEVNEFDFIEGKPFVEIAPKHAVITEDIADRYYNSNALGEKIEIQNVEYEIVGVVKNYSSLSNPLETAKVWVSIQYNRFIPSSDWDDYSYVVLFSEDVPVDEMKATLKHFFDTYYSKRVKKEVDIKYNKFPTVQEIKENALGGEMFRYGMGVLMFLLLLIPALNIMTLSLSNTLNRSQEIAIRRALGASRMSSFMLIISENIILAFIGLFVAMLSFKPVMRLIESMFFDLTAEASFISASSLDWTIVCISLLLAVVFAVLSGGIPAYMMSKKNISSVLKGREL